MRIGNFKIQHSLFLVQYCKHVDIHTTILQVARLMICIYNKTASTNFCDDFTNVNRK